MPHFLLGVCLLFLFLLQCCGPSCPQPRPVTYRIPILETVVQENVGARIVPEVPDNSYTIFGAAQLSFRVLGDTNIKVVADGLTLPRRAQSTATSGWFEPAGTTVNANRSFFWDIAVQLPPSTYDPSKMNFVIEFIYDIPSSTPQPELRVTLHLQGHDPAFAKDHVRPSEVFVDNSDNTKDDDRMENSIVAKGVTLAGWISDLNGSLGRNDGTSAGTAASEDWHYDIYLDPDFIDRNYGTAYAVEPVNSAIIPGNVVPLAAGSATPMPLVSPGMKPSVSSFMMSGISNFSVELNAWHISARRTPPASWVPDPDQFHFSDNAWPYDPRKGSNDPNGPDLQIGDYVIVSGTLWEDTAHTTGNSEPLRHCMDGRFKGQGGWLELHPVDAVRRVEAPPIRKHVIELAACGPGDAQTFSVHLTHPLPPPDKNSHLKFQVLTDPRLTSANATHAEDILENCEPPFFSASADAQSNGNYNAAYIFWWEEGAPRTGTAICIPALGNILRPASD